MKKEEKNIERETTEALSKTNVISRLSLWWKQRNCKHEKWDCDTQIRTIQCRECSKRAWIEDYRSLY